MPSLRTQPVAIDTVAPGLTRRRVWQSPAIRSHALITLTFARLYLAPANATIRPETAQAILQGGDLESVFGMGGTVIDLPTVRRVALDLEANTLTLDFRDTLTPRSGAIQTGQVVIEFETAEASDELFTKLWRRLGNRLKLHQDRRPTRELIRTPLAAMVGVLLVTLVSALAVALVADGGKPEAQRLFIPDWRWVCGLGGAAVAALQVWLYRRWTTPPVKLELLPSE